jgi:hypothetical protein
MVNSKNDEDFAFTDKNEVTDYFYIESDYI